MHLLDIFSFLNSIHGTPVFPYIRLLFDVIGYLGGILFSFVLLKLSLVAKVSPIYDGASLEYKCICTKLIYDYHIGYKC